MKLLFMMNGNNAENILFFRRVNSRSTDTATCCPLHGSIDHEFIQLFSIDHLSKFLTSGSVNMFITNRGNFSMYSPLCDEIRKEKLLV